MKNPIATPTNYVKDVTNASYFVKSLSPLSLTKETDFTYNEDMNVSLPSFEEQKNEVERSLARTLLTQLEQERVTYSELQDMARFILKGIDDAKDSSQLLSFLQTLGMKWSVFESIYGLYRLKVKDDLDTKEDLQKAKAALQALGGGV